MRLIDADAMILEINELPYRVHGKVINLIAKQLTIEERKRGKWTNDNSCPFCKFQPWFEKDIHTLSFCPNCGADMRGTINVI